MKLETQSDIDMALAEDMGRFFNDPLGFVMYAYPWKTDKSIQIVKLQEPWASRYGCEYGPDVWACKFLDELGEQVKQNGFDGINPVAAIREAIKSGHGVGKSAMTGWLVDWIMSTRPYAQGTVTANTAPQLESKTWAQITKWTKLCITSHWFKVTTGKGNMKMVHKDYPESWFCTAQTCREENAESFAGQHAANSTSFYIFDESSAVPDKIAEVAEGGLTDGEPMIFKFGNPTRNSGHFFQCFGRMKHRWHCTTIDSREVQITNKKQLQEWIDDYGLDSDFVRIRVLGKFPHASSCQFIGNDIVKLAMANEVADQAFQPILIGVDVARFGDDQSVIYVRRGRDARNFEILRFRGLDTQQLASKVAEIINKYRRFRPATFVDGGGVGGGVVDRLRALGYDVHEVNFAAKSSDPRYANKRAQMYGRLREWLPEGAIPNDEELIDDILAVEYGYRVSDNSILLEKKEDMKKRGLASPDTADALALTFAEDVAPLENRQGTDTTQIQTDYNPYDAETDNNVTILEEHDPYARIDECAYLKNQNHHHCQVYHLHSHSRNCQSPSHKAPTSMRLKLAA